MIHLVDHRNLASMGTLSAPDLRFHLLDDNEKRRNVIDVPIDDFQESSLRFGRGPVASSRLSLITGSRSVK
ncbi:hypothetical protein K439DRAFT_1635520 [Ramaria rubella]|nr:hypothetical protein K439DRAFT_1635520 [Ramaria rubella]